MNRLHRYVSRLRLAKEALNFVIPHFETNPRVTWIIYLYTRTYIYTHIYDIYIYIHIYIYIQYNTQIDIVKFMDAGG